MEDFDDDNIDVFKFNIVECYSIRLDLIFFIDKFCFVEFVVYYYKDYRKDFDEISDV